MVMCILVGVPMVLRCIEEGVPEDLIDIYKSVSFVPSVTSRKRP